MAGRSRQWWSCSGRQRQNAQLNAEDEDHEDAQAEVRHRIDDDRANATGLIERAAVIGSRNDADGYAQSHPTSSAVTPSSMVAGRRSLRTSSAGRL